MGRMEEAVKILDELIQRCDYAAGSSLPTMLSEWESITLRVEGFLKSVFVNGEERFKESTKDVPLADLGQQIYLLSNQGHVQRYKEDKCLNKLRTLKTHLEKYKDEIRLNFFEGDPKEDKKLDKDIEKIKKRLEKAELEKTRRKTVLEGKEYGADMQRIDDLRDRLKEYRAENKELKEEIKKHKK